MSRRAAHRRARAARGRADRRRARGRGDRATRRATQRAELRRRSPSATQRRAAGSTSCAACRAMTRDGRRDPALGEHRRALRPRPGRSATAREGIGLLRTEVFALSSRGLPDEDEQQRALPARRRRRSRPIRSRCAASTWAATRRCPDEAIDEANPQLGWRAIRILLDRPELFRTQLRAIVRANAARQPARDAADDRLGRRGRGVARAPASRCARELGAAPPPLGVMIETPAAVAIAQHLATRCGLLLDRHQRPDAVHARDRPRERARRADLRSVPSRRAVGDRSAPSTPRARPGFRARCAASWAAIRSVAPLLIGMGIEELSMAPFSVLVLRQVVRTHRRRRDGGLRARRRARARARATCASDSREPTPTHGLLDDPDLGCADAAPALGVRVDRRSDPSIAWLAMASGASPTGARTRSWPSTSRATA